MGLRHLAVLLATVVAVVGTPACAAKPEWAANGNGKDERPKQRQDNGPGRPGSMTAPAGSVGIAIGGYFGDRQRESVRIVFGQQMAQGGCPPGLAKKGNGCRPPGQTKAWKLGQPLPRGVVTHPIPRDLQRRLGDPPPGYEFVRVAADILLIAVGTAIVIDAVEDLAGQ